MKERPKVKPTYPKLPKGADRRVKLLEEDKQEIVVLFEWGMERRDLQEIYGVSYHSIYWLTCNEVTKLAYENRQKQTAHKVNELRKSDPKRARHFQDLQNKSRKYKRELNPDYREFLRLEWLRKHPVSPQQ